MRLTVLGSGTCELKAERSSPAYLVSADATSVVLDLGQGAWRRLLEVGANPTDVDAVLLSHHHLDHCADLLPLLFALNYDPVLSVETRLTLVGDTALARVLRGLAETFGEWVQPSSTVFKVNLVEPGSTLEAGSVAISTTRAAHMDSSLAYRLEHEGVSLVYLGDSRATDSLVDFARGADLLICHCVGTAENPKPNHMTPESAGSLAAEAGVGTLLLSHFYRSQDVEASVEAAKAGFAGAVWAAHDLLTLEIDQGGVVGLSK